MSIKLTKISSNTYYEFVNIKSVELNIKRNIVDVTIPGEDKPDIMTIGGVDWYMSFVAEVVSDNIADEVQKLDDMFGTGQICEKFLLDLDEWGWSGEYCVVEDVRIRQIAGEPNKIEVEVHLIVGNILC